MQTLPRDVNPFALMLDPQSVLDKIEHSERLERLHRRICRPLDKPMLGLSAEEPADAADSLDSADGVDTADISDGVEMGMLAEGAVAANTGCRAA